MTMTLDDLNRLRHNAPVANVSKYYADAGIVLPEFVRSSVAAEEQRVVLSYADGVYRSSAHPETSYDTIVEAHESHDKEVIISFDTSILSSPEPGLRFMEGMLPGDVLGIFVQQDDDSSRLLYTGTSEEDRLVDDYVEFLFAHEQWKAEKNLATAWAFVDRHPVFWHKVKTSRESMWTLDAGWEHLYMTSYLDDGKVHALIEGGGYDERNQDYTARYADMLLVVTRSSMDEAIIAFAERVEEVFGASNEENPGYRQKRESILDQMLNRD